MFIGHFAVGLAAKASAPKPSLGTYLLAAQLLDLLWPLLLLAGFEHVEIHVGDTAVTPLAFVSYPYSHSLLATFVYALLVAGTYYFIRSDRKGALLLGGAVLSHWILDAITHRPDLPLTPGGSMMIGLGLWESVAGTLIVESGMFLAAAWFYFRSTKSLDKTGTIVPWLLVTLLYLTYLMNIFSPEPPPSPEIIGWVSLGIWLYIVLGYWGDRHRAIIR